MAGGRIHLVLISNLEGYVLFERFYDATGDAQRAEWRAALRETSADNVAGAVAALAPKHDSHREPEDTFVGMHRARHVVYTVCGDVVVYLVGSGEYDDLGLMEVGRVLLHCLRGVCRKQPSEALVGEHFGEVCLMVEEVICEGMLEATDWDTVRRGMKLKTGEKE